MNEELTQEQQDWLVADAAHALCSWIEGDGRGERNAIEGGRLEQGLLAAHRATTPSAAPPTHVIVAVDERERAHELLYEAWGVIANAGGTQGGWDSEAPEWVVAAERWRDAWHAFIGVRQDGA